MKYLVVEILITILIMLLGEGCDFIKNTDQSVNPGDTVKFTGEMQKYFENGQVKSVIKYENGKRNGITKNYDPNGHLASVVNYENNRKNGVSQNYYPNGKLHSTITYKENIKHGIEKWYYENGQVYRINPYNLGMLDGVQKKYYQNGNLMSLMPYKNGNACAGLKEYRQDGKTLLPEPSIIVDIEDNLDINGTYTLHFSLSDKSRKVSYFIGELGKNQELHGDLESIPGNNGKGSKRFIIPNHMKFNQTINVIAVKKTRFKNTLIIQKRIPVLL